MPIAPVHGLCQPKISLDISKRPWPKLPQLKVTEREDIYFHSSTKFTLLRYFPIFPFLPHDFTNLLDLHTLSKTKIVILSSHLLKFKEVFHFQFQCNDKCQGNINKDERLNWKSLVNIASVTLFGSTVYIEARSTGYTSNGSCVWTCTQSCFIDLGIIMAFIKVIFHLCLIFINCIESRVGNFPRIWRSFALQNTYN